ncbi:DMT family transporter [Sphingobium boeckii]|uniref:Drug/metabolite transporter (DMT)-like permease n=1 Tax=Sphingobium boeckii TaxID=1082345 RepID=A0A7W9EGU4_9SPHN|nr:DMT family transporter [Sphingobium boeckii]MBB5687081.1 drug/metabolite transporter (DMT)-like permease [Sphingobium boeckii]
MPSAPSPRVERRFYALGLRLLAIFCLASMGALIKLASARGVHLVEIMFFRQLLAVPVVLLWVLLGPGILSLKTRRLPRHITRTIFGMIGMTFNFGAVVLLPLAEATTLQFTVPIFATILSVLILKEVAGIHRWGAVILGFIGVLIVVQPGHGHFPLYAGLVGLMAAFMVAVISIQLRELGKTETAPTTVFWFSLLSVPVFGTAYLFFAQAHDTASWALLAGIGTVGGLGQMALTAALRWAPVSVVVPMDYSSLIWATLYGYVLFSVLPGTSTWLGAPLIIASGLYIVWREHRLSRQNTATITAAAD